MSLGPSPRGIQDWQVAEENAATWMRHWGFRDARLTGAGTDGGVDVRSGGALAQVKMQGTPVGRPAIQNLVGARRLDHDKALLFFSNSGYASTAVVEANLSGVALFQYSVASGRMTAVNGVARQLVQGARVADERPSLLGSIQEAWNDAGRKSHQATVEAFRPPRPKFIPEEQPLPPL